MKRIVNKDQESLSKAYEKSVVSSKDGLIIKSFNDNAVIKSQHVYFEKDDFDELRVAITAIANRPDIQNQWKKTVLNRVYDILLK